MVLFSMKASAVIAGLLAAGCARAHMFLATPVRFNQIPQVTSGPLLADGSNYPCQAGSSGQYTPQQINIYPLGSSQMIAFDGTAVHAGGSGQAVLTYDTAPRPNSVFKVLKSFEGGFVAKGQTGNMGDSASAPDPYTYTFDVPKDIPTGNATMGITWFNKVGNREYYFMCAPIMLTGSGGDKANYDALPDMFKANIGNGCGTQDSKDVVFPDPGKIVERNNGATTEFATPTGTGCQTAGARPAATAGSSADSGASGGAASSAGSSSAGGSFFTSAVEPPPPASTGSAPGFSGSYSITMSVPAPSASTTVVPPPPPPATTTAASRNTGSGSGSGSGGALSGACASEGTFNCIDGTRYQQCGSGMWSVAMPVAPGTKCQVGSGPSLNVTPAKLRFRGVRFDA